MMMTHTESSSLASPTILESTLQREHHQVLQEYYHPPKAKCLSISQYRLSVFPLHHNMTENHIDYLINRILTLQNWNILHHNNKPLTQIVEAVIYVLD